MTKRSFLSHADAAELNRNLVLNYVKNLGPVSRTDIWESINLSRASVTHIIRQLQDMDLILEIGEGESSGGRRPLQLLSNKDARLLYVFDWVTSSISLLNIGGEILYRTVLSFPRNCTPNTFAHIVMQGLNKIENEVTVDKKKLLGLGLSMPGQIDNRNCILLYSVELGWRDVNIASLFADCFKHRVFLERTANMMALGEYTYGAAKNVNHVLMVQLSRDGIGCSLIIRGNCQHGSNYMVGELGHIKLFNSNVTCSCGQVGCLEAVVNDCLLHNGNVIDSKIINYISMGIAAVVNVMDPQMVILSGNLIFEISEKQMNEFKAKIRSNVTNERSRKLDILVSEDYENMVIKGMCAYIFNECFSIA